MKYQIEQKYDATQVLVVDADPDDAAFTASALRSAGCRVRQTFDGDRALELTRAYRPDIVFLNVNLPEQSGWLVCSKLKSVGPAPVVVLVGTDRAMDGADARFARFVHAEKLLYKPLSERDVLGALSQLVRCGC